MTEYESSSGPQVAALVAMAPNTLYTRFASVMAARGVDLTTTLLPPDWRGLLNERLLDQTHPHDLQPKIDVVAP